MKKQQFELLPGLRVKVGDNLYRIVLEHQSCKNGDPLPTPMGAVCASKIVAVIERRGQLDDSWVDSWVPVATGGSYRSWGDSNQPNALVCTYNGRHVSPKDLAVLRAIEADYIRGDPTAFDRVTRGALKACWYSRRKLKAQTSFDGGDIRNSVIYPGINRSTRPGLSFTLKAAIAEAGSH